MREINHCTTVKRWIILARIALLFAWLLGISTACIGRHVGDGIVTDATVQEEGRQSVTAYELKWSSLAAHRDPNVQSEIAVDPYLHYAGYGREGYVISDEPYWLITKSIDVKTLTVLEHSPDRLKVMAHIVRQIDEITPSGELRQSFSPVGSCRVYAFTRQSNIWKLAGLFDMTNINNVSRDWRDAPDWLRQVIGDLPQNRCND
jgi:hypothetical protein